MPIYLTIKEVAEMFKINRATVYLWIEKGLPSFTIGRNRRFIQEEIEQWLKDKRKGDE